LTGHELAFGVDDGRAFFALGLGLFGHGTDHRLGKFDIFEFDGLDVDAPSSGVLFDNSKDFGGDLLSLGEQLVECSLTSDAAHGGLSELKHGVINIFDFVDSLPRVDDFVVDDSVHFAGHVVFGDCVLFGDIDRFGTDVDFAERLEDGDDNLPSWSDDVAKFTHGVDDPALVLVDLFERDQDKKNNERENKFHRAS